MFDATPEQRETVLRILAQHVPDCEVRAFGSRVTPTHKPYSDLDLVIVGAAALESGRMRSLAQAFEESDLSFRVDVIDWNATSPAFRAVIDRHFEIVQPAAAM